VLKKDANIWETQAARAEVQAALTSMGATHQEIANELGVNRQRIQQIMSGSGWKLWEPKIHAAIPVIAKKIVARCAAQAAAACEVGKKWEERT